MIGAREAMPRKSKYDKILDEMMDSVLDHLATLPEEEGKARLEALATYSSSAVGGPTLGSASAGASPGPASEIKGGCIG